MKRTMLICLLAIGASGIVYASSGKHCHDYDRNIHPLNLEPERAEEVANILRSYKKISALYMTGQRDKIPTFLAEKEGELSQVLSEVEMEKLKQGFADWAQKKDFLKFGYMNKAPTDQF